MLVKLYCEWNSNSVEYINMRALLTTAMRTSRRLAVIFMNDKMQVNYLTVWKFQILIIILHF